MQGIDADLDVSLTGPRLDSLTGTARVDVTGARVAGGTLRPTQVAATFRDGAATFDASGGAAPWVRLTAHGTGRPLDSLPSWDLRANVQQLDPLDVGGMRVASTIATVRASGTGVSPASARGRARVDLTGSMGRVGIDGAVLTADWDSATANAVLDVPVGAGHLSARTRASWAVRRPGSRYAPSTRGRSTWPSSSATRSPERSR